MVALLIATGLAAHILLHVLIGLRLKLSWNLSLLWDALGCLAGLYVADFLTSLAHYLGDCRERWHSRYLRPYRELARHHHEAPLAVLQESFWQLRGNIAWLYAPPLLLALYLAEMPTATPVVLMLVTLSNGLLFSHTLHKWLHAAQQPWPLQMLMALRLVISRDYHMRHHVPPFDRNFAALNGWADWLFERLVARDRDDRR
jgi:hypothetical protein